MNQNKIVITGIGALAPNGNNVTQFWNNLTEGVSGIAPITYFNTENTLLQCGYFIFNN